MNVAAYYEAHVVNGRAVLEGSLQSPIRWLVRVQAVSRDVVGYVYCSDHAIHCTMIDGQTELTPDWHVPSAIGHFRTRKNGPRDHWNERV